MFFFHAMCVSCQTKRRSPSRLQEDGLLFANISKLFLKRWEGFRDMFGNKAEQQRALAHV